ncbi:MAG: hypothetical protein U5K29_00765 [Acidimicrobiales bacterium]|nr:hypothetical protein [Acidimicrobiales bacterium]
MALRKAIGTVANTSAGSDLRRRVEAGEITADDAADAVRSAALDELARERIQWIAADLDRPITSLSARALRGDADRIVAELRPHFDRAAGVVAKSVKRFGNDPDRKAILAAGPEAAANWQERQDALAELDEIRQARNSLPSNGRARSAWYVVPRRPGDLERAQELYGAPGNFFVNLIEAGLELRLNTEAEAREHEQGMTRMRAQHRAEAEAERLDANEARARPYIERWEALISHDADDEEAA